LSEGRIRELEKASGKCIACIVAGAGMCVHLEVRRERQPRDSVGAIAARILTQYGALMGRPGPIRPEDFSPIEERLLQAFWEEDLYPELQYNIGPYYADFAFPDTSVVVEADGKAYHQDADREQRRDSYLRRAGWKVFHFTGREINRDARSCVNRVYNLVRTP
jgi:very-short-patch-repair endonuclease